MQIDRRLSSRPTPLRPRRRFGFSWPGFRFWFLVAAVGFLGAGIVALAQVALFVRGQDRLPPGQVVANIPVGGLTAQEAAARLTAAYSAPVTLDYRGSLIQLGPAQVDFTLDIQAMLAQVSRRADSESLPAAFWAYAWGEAPTAPEPVALQASIREAALEAFLSDLAARYDDAGTPARADPDTLGFKPGSAGRALDRDAAFALINAALRLPTARNVTLPVNDFASRPPTFDTLADLLYTNIRLHQFSGMVSIYVGDLETGDELSLAAFEGQPFSVGEGIAFSGMSTIKIPVMVTFFRYKDEAVSSDESLLLEGIFAESANAYTDLILGLIGTRQAGGGLVGANMVSDTMAELGLRNTYIAGLLDTLGAITTPRITPGNSRTDVDLNPDLYNQTSAEDMGRLMVMIHDCIEGRGRLLETFPEQFTPEECQLMIDTIAFNEVGPIFISGGSPGAKVVHKHGWDLLPLNNVADAAYVFSPHGDYVMTIFVHRATPVAFDQANRLIISLATAVSNYFGFER